MIRSAIGSGIGAGALLLAGSHTGAATPDVVAANRATLNRVAIAPRLYASLLPRARMPGGDDVLLRAGGGMIELVPFGEGFSLSARDRPDRGGARNWTSLRAGSARGMTFGSGPESLGGRSVIRKFAPALLLGYGKHPERGLNFALEAGMLLRSGLLASPLSGLGRTSLPGIGQIERGHGTALAQARIGYRF
jgi:hypothetical protein